MAAAVRAQEPAMDVLQTKQLQFSPVVLYLPGHEHEKKKFLKDEPEMWKIFRRLSRTQQHLKPGLSSQSQSPECRYVPATIEIPGKEGMRCMCYQQLMKIIKERSCIQPPKSFRCSNGRTCLTGTDSVFPTWPKKALLAFRNNEELQFPLGTVIVRWQQKRNLPKYNKTTLKTMLQKFGPIQDVRVLGTNSCLVIFEEVSSACKVMQARHLGEPTNPLHCTWWHRSMANKTVAVQKRGIVVQTDLYLT